MKTFRNFFDFDSTSDLLKKHCEVLDVKFPFTLDTLKSKFRDKSKETHPDANKKLNGDGSKFHAVQKAYEFLTPYASEELTEKQVQEIEWSRTRIEELEPFKNFSDCTRCHGKGRWFEEMEVPIYADGSDDTCPKCGGDGKFKLPCRACGGTGKFTQRNSGRVVDCRKCNGTGQFPVGTCRECGGDGHYSPSFMNMFGLGGFFRRVIGHKKEQVRRECSSCDGTGRVEILNPVLKKGVVAAGSKRRK